MQIYCTNFAFGIHQITLGQIPKTVYGLVLFTLHLHLLHGNDQHSRRCIFLTFPPGYHRAIRPNQRVRA